jgi:hypothetical protein
MVIFLNRLKLLGGLLWPQNEAILLLLLQLLMSKRRGYMALVIVHVVSIAMALPVYFLGVHV